MVTLSCLIVEAGLYSQVNSNMPTFASPKSVDIYFFFFILRLFLVCVHHTMNHRWLKIINGGGICACPKAARKNAPEKNNEKTKGSANSVKQKELQKVKVPEAPEYYTPDDISVLFNGWTSNKTHELQREKRMRYFRAMNVFVFVLFNAIDAGFLGAFVYWIITERGELFDKFNETD